MTFPRLIACFLSALIALTFAACASSDQPDAPDVIPLDDWTNYTVVRSDSSDPAAVSAATRLVSSVAETTGVKLKLETDWVKRGESAPVGTKEILIGATNRPESDASVKKHDFLVSFENGRVVLRGGDSEATGRAVDWFLENCVAADGLKIPASPYTDAAVYPGDSITLAGQKLSDFSIVCPNDKTARSAADELAEWFADQTGASPAVAENGSGAVIRLAVDPKAVENPFETLVSITSDGVCLTVNGTGVSLSGAVQTFIETINSRESDEIQAMTKNIASYGGNASYTANFDTLYAFRGHESQALFALDAKSSILTGMTYTLVGNQSSGTHFDGNRLVTAADEKADSMTAILARGDETLAIPVAVLDAPKNTASFDDKNVVATFSVVSDTHVSGSWNQSRSVSKWVHAIDVMQRAAGTNADGSTKLDAFLHVGDFIDAINSFGNVNANTNSYGPKAAQNYRELAYVRSGLEGKNTNSALTVAAGSPEVKTGFGSGLSVPFFYCLGNHDEAGMGVSSTNEKYQKVYTAEYFVALFCGWNYDPSLSKTSDGAEDSYRAYAADLIALYEAGGRDADVKAFTAKHGADGAYALERFKAYYGADTDLTADTTGLTVGNRHAVIGGVHLIAIEKSQSAESAAFLEKWCAESVKEDPAKPIIVLTHEKMPNTFDWSDGSHSSLFGVLGRYPQCIVLTGHTHSPLTNEDAILSENGFTSIEASVIAYLSCERMVGGELPAPGNYLRKEDHEFGDGLLISVDKNGNVKIRRIDVYRSYNKDLGFENEPVFIGEPWIISGISETGSHLLAYNSERGKAPNNKAPEFPAGAKASVSTKDGKLTVSFPAASDDDLVRYYLVELTNPNDPADKPYQYVSSMFFKYADAEELAKAYPSYTIPFPAVKEKRDSASMDKVVTDSTPKAGVSYHVKVTPYDVWHTAGNPITD